jgi:putative hydrolase of the HAD superfamily
MTITNGIKNIILDWGGVIINIDYMRTKNAFIGMGLKDFEDHYTQFQQKEIFDLLDVGKISGEQFFSELHKHMPNGTSVGQLKDAWNAMLLDFPEENYQLLMDLKDKYRTFLFSNTNEPHLQYYFKKLEKWYGITEMDPLFEKAYYSCRFGMRKPDPESFRTIIKENDLDPSETLFVDDSIQHIEGAKEAGLRVYHLVAPERLTDVLGV